MIDSIALARDFHATTQRDFARGPILVVEDDQDIRESIAEVLRDEGHEAWTAAHGAEALALLRRAGCPVPRLILLDLMMPVMNGWEFRAELSKDALLASIPIVVLSGDARITGKAAELRAAGALAKPVSITGLLEVVGQFG